MKIPKFEAQTEWVKPTEFPDLRQVDEIAIDLESKDPDLIKKGSGSVIGNGDVIGIAVATNEFIFNTLLLDAAFVTIVVIPALAPTVEIPTLKVVIPVMVATFTIFGAAMV